jgi:hypothetical protein
MAVQLLQQHIPVDDLVNLVGSYLMVSAESISASKQCVIDEFIQQVHFKSIPFVYFDHNPVFDLAIGYVIYHTAAVSIILN